MRKVILLTLSIMIALGGIACAKKNANETPAETKARKTAVYSAQGVTALDGFQDLTVVLEDNAAISPEAAKAVYTSNKAILTSFDVLRSRLQQGLNGDAIARIEAILADVEKLENDLNAIKDENAQAKFDEVLFTVRFTLNSIKAVIAATAEPSFAEARKVAAQARNPRAGRPAWWTDAILVVQNTVVRMLEQSRMSQAEAWTDADALSSALHSKIGARLN